MGYRVPDAVHHELQNWARWCWLGEWPCEATNELGWMGGRPITDAEDDERPYVAPPHGPSAEVVQQAWAAMDELPRKVLRAEYPARDGAGRVAAARRLGLTLDGYETVLASGVHRIEEACSALFA